MKVMEPFTAKKAGLTTHLVKITNWLPLELTGSINTIESYLMSVRLGVQHGPKTETHHNLQRPTVTPTIYKPNWLKLIINLRAIYIYSTSTFHLP